VWELDSLGKSASATVATYVRKIGTLDFDQGCCWQGIHHHRLWWCRYVSPVGPTAACRMPFTAYTCGS
jgi:hypothetical protein